MKIITFNIFVLLVILGFTLSSVTNAQNSGEIILKVQEKLIELGFNSGQPDGEIGKETTKALKDYQRGNSINISGEIDQQALKSLGVIISDGSVTKLDSTKKNIIPYADLGWAEPIGVAELMTKRKKNGGLWYFMNATGDCIHTSNSIIVLNSLEALGEVDGSPKLTKIDMPQVGKNWRFTSLPNNSLRIIESGVLFVVGDTLLISNITWGGNDVTSGTIIIRENGLELVESISNQSKGTKRIINTGFASTIALASTKESNFVITGVVGSKGLTNLMFASKEGDFKVVAELLTSANAYVNTANSEGLTSLMFASEKGHFEIVKLLTSASADINAANSEGLTSLMIASEKGHFEVVKVLTSASADINAANSEGLTALMLASEKGHFEVVKVLTSANADVNAANSEGLTSLMLASKLGYLDIVNSLVLANADIKLISKAGNTALMYAAEYGHNNIIRSLLSISTNNTYINKKNNLGETALILASKNKFPEAVNELIQSGANINDEDNLGMSTFLYASQKGLSEVVETLISLKVDINNSSKNGKTALMYAAENGHSFVLEVLLANNASIDQKSKLGQTALMFASQNDKSKIIILLLKNNAEIDIQDKENRTALMLASHNGCVSSVKVLLIAGANKKLRDINSKTAEKIAKTNNQKPVIRLFKWNSSKFFFNFNINNSVLTTSGYSSGLGAGIGIGFSTRLTHRLILQNEAIFNIRTSNISREILDIVGQPYYELHSVDLIPSIKVVLGDSFKNHFYLLVGAGYQKLISVNILNDSDEAFEEDILTNVTSKSDGSSFSINTGLGYMAQTSGHRFPYFEVRYSYGLSTKIDNINTSVNSTKFIIGIGF